MVLRFTANISHPFSEGTLDEDNGNRKHRTITLHAAILSTKVTEKTMVIIGTEGKIQLELHMAHRVPKDTVHAAMHQVTCPTLLIGSHHFVEVASLLIVQIWLWNPLITLTVGHIGSNSVTFPRQLILVTKKPWKLWLCGRDTTGSPDTIIRHWDTRIYKRSKKTSTGLGVVRAGKLIWYHSIYTVVAQGSTLRNVRWYGTGRVSHYTNTQKCFPPIRLNKTEVALFYGKCWPGRQYFLRRWHVCRNWEPLGLVTCSFTMTTFWIWRRHSVAETDSSLWSCTVPWWKPTLLTPAIGVHAGGCQWCVCLCIVHIYKYIYIYITQLCYWPNENRFILYDMIRARKPVIFMLLDPIAEEGH